MPWNGIERRSGFRGCPLTEQEFQDVATRAAEKAVEKALDHVYIEVGKSAIRALLLLVGAVGAAVLAWFNLAPKK